MGAGTVWGGVHPMPARTNAQQAHNIYNLRGSWLVGATFKCGLLVGANFELVDNPPDGEPCEPQVVALINNKKMISILIKM